MLEWAKRQDGGWQLDLREAGSRLPRLELHQGKGTWIICVVGPRSSRARTGAAWGLEEAQRMAVLEAQAFLDARYQPLLSQLLSESAPSRPMEPGSSMTAREGPFDEPDAPCQCCS